MLQQIETSGEQVIVLSAQRVLVASKSEPGRWHEVVSGRCDCRGFLYRGRCCHLAAAAAQVRPAPARFARTPAAAFDDFDRKDDGEYETIHEFLERRGR